jgi:hypothetical protein
MLLTKNYKDSTTLEITDITIVSTQIVRGSRRSDCCCFDQYNNLSIYASTSNKSFLFQNFKAVGDTSTTTMFDVLVPYKMLYFESAGRMQRKSK